MLAVRSLTAAAVLSIASLACGLFSRSVLPTPVPQPSPVVIPSDTSAAAPSAAASDTPAPSQPVPAVTDTPNPLTQGLPLPFANMEQISQYFEPFGQPASDWNGIPIMPEATAGQEFKPGQVYSFKATATIEQCVSFYESKLPAAGYTSYIPGGTASGTNGSGSNAMHSSLLYMIKGTQVLLINIASYDSDPGHSIVVMSAG